MNKRTVNVVRALAVGAVGFAAAAGASACTIVLDDVPTMAEAQAFVANNQFDEAADAFGAITEAQPENQQAWFMLGYSLHGAGELDEAIEIHKKVEAFNAGQISTIAAYNLGCAHALKGDKDKAFAALGRAVDAGMRTKVQFEGDSDLTSLKEDTRWGELMKRIDGKPTLAQGLHFWVGEWDCYDKQGTLNGTNTLAFRVEKKVIHESWVGAGSGGYVGESWNWFDPANLVWKQVWVDRNGAVVEFIGKPKDNGILFEGARPQQDGTLAQVRMFVRPVEGGRVQQTGTESTDKGETWQTKYDLTYVPKGEAYAAADAES